MAAYKEELNKQLSKRNIGSQYIYFATKVVRCRDVSQVNVGDNTNIFPAFEEMFSYIKTVMPKKLDIVFISDGADNNMHRCRADFATHLYKLQSEFPEVDEHRLFTIGVGPNFPCDLVRLISIT